MTDFHDVRFPIRLALGAQGGPERKIEIVTLANGKEIRNAVWSGSRRKWEIGSAIATLKDLQQLVAFFEARCGRLYGFRFRDPLDYRSAPAGQSIRPDDQFCGTADGAQIRFPLQKYYGDKPRRIRKPVSDTVRLAINSVELMSGWRIEAASGDVVFDHPPAQGSEISAGFEFDCAVRFDNERFTGVLDAFNAGRAIAITLIELV